MGYATKALSVDLSQMLSSPCHRQCQVARPRPRPQAPLPTEAARAFCSSGCSSASSGLVFSEIAAPFVNHLSIDLNPPKHTPRPKTPPTRGAIIRLYRWRKVGYVEGHSHSLQMTCRFDAESNFFERPITPDLPATYLPMMVLTTTTMSLAKAAAELQTRTCHGIYHPPDSALAQCSRHSLRLTASQQREGVVLLAGNGMADS